MKRQSLLIAITTAVLIWSLQANTAISKFLGLSDSQKPQALEQASPTPVITKKPQAIRIPSVAIDVDIKESTVSENDWGLYDDAASYLVTSGKLGNQGNAVFYAHNTKVLLGGLRYAKVGDRIFVETDKGEDSYIITETKVVSPEQIDIVYSTNDERLTIFTCTNFLDADRFVVIAKPAATFGDMLEKTI